MNHITSTNEPYPSEEAAEQATKLHIQGRFRIASRKLPISKAGPIDAMGARLGIPIPEMIFGGNLVSVTHAPTGWAISFAAEPALDRVDKTGANMLQVAHAVSWSSSREQTSAANIRQVVKPYDWSYSTDYRGTLGGLTGLDGEKHDAAAQAADEAVTKQPLKPSQNPIPLELLKRRDPILFFDEVVLYESELDDNGVSMLSVKVRVMEKRMLLLCRLFMRVDNVVVRVRDTRVYVDFETDTVTREYTAKEDKFDNVKRSLLMSGLMPDGITIAMKDANQVAHLLPTVEHELESVCLAQAS